MYRIGWPEVRIKLPKLLILNDINAKKNNPAAGGQPGFHSLGSCGHTGGDVRSFGVHRQWGVFVEAPEAREKDLALQQSFMVLWRLVFMGLKKRRRVFTGAIQMVGLG
jgi:hypothetical protein